MFTNQSYLVAVTRVWVVYCTLSTEHEKKDVAREESKEGKSSNASAFTVL
jgi:hypothetical protein